MIRLQGYQNQRMAVFGLARTGLSAGQALLAAGAEVLCWDDSPTRRQAAVDLGMQAVEPDAQNWHGISAVILSPGVPLTHPAPHAVVSLAKELGAEVIGDVELFARSQPAAPIINVTGTNGKSTTTALISHLINACGRPAVAGGNLGLPVLELEELDGEGVYVLELSSYQIDLLNSMRAAVNILLNISPDHLDRHGGMEGYVAAKARLFRMGGGEAQQLISVNDTWSQALADELEREGAKVTRFAVGLTLDEGYFALKGKVYRAKNSVVSQLADLQGIETLRGAHNWQNATAALAALDLLGLDMAAVAQGLESFAGLPHRMELVVMSDGIRFINDSKATNAEAASHALSAYENIFWIAGGRAKEDGIASLAPWFEKINKAFLIGEASEAFAATLSPSVPHEICGTLDVALKAAAKAAQAAKGGTVLLSPACASFDQFDSFEARGDAFRALVHELLRATDAQPQRMGGAA